MRGTSRFARWTDSVSDGTIGPIDGFRRGIRMCMDLGYDDDAIRKMISTNTARMLGFEADVAAAMERRHSPHVPQSRL